MAVKVLEIVAEGGGRTSCPNAAGTLVQLKSGGPVMTVSSHLEGSSYGVYWFDKDDVQQRGYFHPNALDVVESAPLPAWRPRRPDGSSG